MIYNSIFELIGNTPLMRLCEIEKKHALNAVLLAKLEMFNPAGSTKDRAAASILHRAEEKGVIKSGSVIIEPTSGNTGIALAALAAKKGYRVILTMPDSMSIERRRLLKAYGAELVLTPGSLGMAGAVKRAQELCEQIPGAFIAGQFTNPANPDAHRHTTGPEIWRDTQGKIDIFAACVGTGGTFTGTAAYLKEQNPSIRAVAVEPAGSPLISKGVSGAHKIQGIGANFIPEVLDKSLIDEVVTVEDDEAINTMKELAVTEGILAGISSGAAIAAGIRLAQRPENKSKTVAVILPDTGERYLSDD